MNNMIAVLLTTFSIFGHVINFDIENVKELQIDHKSSLIPAYPSIKNHQILEGKDTSRFGQLKWFSIGTPTLHSKNSSGSILDVFEITNNGFFLQIEFLTENQRKLFKEEVKREYGIDVKTEQIKNLIPSKLNCITGVQCSNGTWLNLYAKGFDLNWSLLNVKFDAPIECFEHHLIEYNRLDVNCVIRKYLKKVKKNSFNFYSTQMTDAKLLDSLFGNADEVFVTREQLGNLGSELYRSMKIFEQYEVSEKEFDSGLIDAFIKQKMADFNPVSIDIVLKSLSKYSTKDLDPNIIKKNLSKVLKVKTVGDKKHIIANLEYSKSNSDKDHNEMGTSAKAGYAGLSASASFNYVKKKEQSWANSGKSLDDQLKELNGHSQDNIEWEIEGEKIVPKNLKVSRLLKTNFNEKHDFEWIKRFIDGLKAKLDIEFSLNYKNDLLYKRIANTSIETLNSQVILDSIRTKSFINCIEACQDNKICHYVQFSDSTCSLYKKIANLFLKSESGNKQRLYERMSRFKSKEESPVISLKSQKPVRYENFQISGFFLSLTTQSENDCLNECRERRSCIKISYGENRCHLVKKGDYLMRPFNNWVSIYLEGEDPHESQKNSNHYSKKRLDGHKFMVSSLAVLHNGDLVSGSNDKKIKIWNATDGSLKQTLNIHNGSVYSLLVLHNGNIVSSSYDKTMKIWNSQNFQVERTINEHAALSLAVFPNTDFASGCANGTITIWNSTGDYIRTLRGHTGSVLSLAVLPNGKLVSGSSDNTIKIWSHKGNLEKTLYGHTQSVSSLAILNDGLLVSGSLDNTVKIWNEKGQLMHSQPYGSEIRSLAVLWNGKLIIGFEDGKIRINEKNGKHIKSLLAGHSIYLKSLAVFYNGDFASSSDEKIIIWNQK